MAATSTTVVTLDLSGLLHFQPVKLTHRHDVSDIAEEVNFWFREGRRGGTLPDPLKT